MPFFGLIDNFAPGKTIGEQFFDGDRKFGYGGFGYNAKYWENVVKDFVEYYNLPSNAMVMNGLKLQCFR